jgi:DNA/RNA-binding domain of Phe-tRNA-synthetase-like protein
MQFSIDSDNIELGVMNTHVAVVCGVSQAKCDTRQIDLWCAESLERAMEWSPEEIRTHPFVEGFYAVYSRLGYRAKDVSPAAESLVRLVQKRNRFIRIMPAVDCYNSVVVSSLVGIGAHDLDKVVGDVRFTRAAEGDSFVPVGRDRAMPVRKGDFIYCDNEKVLARLAAFDADNAKLERRSRNILLVSEGNQFTDRETVAARIREAAERIVEVCGGKFDVFQPDEVAVVA